MRQVNTFKSDCWFRLLICANSTSARSTALIGFNHKARNCHCSPKLHPRLSDFECLIQCMTSVYFSNKRCYFRMKFMPLSSWELNRECNFSVSDPWGQTRLSRLKTCISDRSSNFLSKYNYSTIKGHHEQTKYFSLCTQILSPWLFIIQ